MNIVKIKNKIFNHYNLNQKESLYLFEEIMSGNINDIELSSILIGLRMKSETKEEIIGASKIMREKSLKINSPENTVDTCGTGGDMSNTLNISTSASIVAASAGAIIAKHGNRSVSSKSGSADMLEKLGYKITADVVELEKSLNEKNFCFLFAQNHHSAMKNVINVRKILATRTIFNLLGPLTNPANSKNQLLGVFDKKWLKIHCEALKELGSHKAMVVHGIDGLDEITLTTNTLIVELKNNTIEEYIFNPTDFGYEYIKIETIKGGDSNYNAKCFVEMLDGNFPNFQKIVEINAGAALYLGKIADNLKEGFDLAKKVIEEGRAKNYLNELIT
mgnify:CR=1 FL=1|tara:strand:- start:453 stop:1451 length:999 start_codon:yes stop_codon:yes gene_type:complete